MTPEEYYITHYYRFYDTIKCCIDLEYVYEFGIFGGKSMLDLMRHAWREKKPVKNFFGFDTFTGLPENTTEHIDWYKGAYSCSDLFGCEPQECANRVQQLATLLFPNTKTKIFCGLYKNLHSYQYDFMPASLVHIDCDTYLSTIDALEFMYQNNLLKIGTIINYNDLFPNEEDVFKLGEGKAHNEITTKYKISCDRPYPNIFRIIKI